MCVTSTLPRPETLQEHKDSYLHHLLHQGFVRAGLGALQPADILADPRDEGELGSLAHRVPGGEAHEGKQSDVICTNGKGRARCSVKTPQIHIPSRSSGPRGYPESHGKSQHSLAQSRQQHHRLGCPFHRREVEAQKGHVTLPRLHRQMEARPLWLPCLRPSPPPYSQGSNSESDLGNRSSSTLFNPKSSRPYLEQQSHTVERWELGWGGEEWRKQRRWPLFWSGI